MRGTEASGGLDQLRALEDLSLELRGVRPLRGLSLRADPHSPARSGTSCGVRSG